MNYLLNKLQTNVQLFPRSRVWQNATTATGYGLSRASGGRTMYIIKFNSFAAVSFNSTTRADYIADAKSDRWDRRFVCVGK